MNVNLDKLDEGLGIAETLQSHSAMYHKSCNLKYTSSKVQRLQKRLLVTSDAATSPKKTKSQLNVSTCQQVQGISKCFFCGEPGGQLHKASTTDIDTHVRESATKLNDSGLLATLAMSDMHALDAQYHRKCLVALYNHMRQYSNRSDTNPSHDRPLSVQAVALAEFTSYIEESAQNDSMTSVFELSDLTKLYVEYLIESAGISCTHRLWYNFRILWHRKKNNLGYLGSLSTSDNRFL